MKTKIIEIIAIILLVAIIILYFNHKVTTVQTSAFNQSNDTIKVLNEKIKSYEVKASQLIRCNDSLQKCLLSIKSNVVINKAQYEKIYNQVLHTSGNNDCKWFDSIYAKR